MVSCLSLDLCSLLHWGKLTEVTNPMIRQQSWKCCKLHSNSTKVLRGGIRVNAAYSVFRGKALIINYWNVQEQAKSVNEMNTSQKYERLDKREQVQRNIPAETHSDEMQAEKIWEMYVQDYK